MKHIVCFSGGHSSALVGIEVARKHGIENLVLLNHDISPEFELPDVKRFKKEVSEYIGVPVTYANHKDQPNTNQFKVCIEASAFKVNNGEELCTNRLKTAPFYKWLETNVPDKDCTIYYGFDANEPHRIQRRSQILGVQGYKTGFPLFNWERTIESTADIGIAPPNQYSIFKHANCIGCLKAGKQHWYVVYCFYNHIFEQAKLAEDEIGFSIDRGGFLEDYEADFKQMKDAGVVPTELVPHQKFWSDAKNRVGNTQTALFNDLEEMKLPCECVF